MAILPRVPGISVEVRVDGEPLEEFFSEDEEDTTNTASRYVEATSGDIFTIHWTYHKSLKCRRQDLNGHALVDGKRVRSAITWSTDWMDQDSHTIDVTGVCLHEQGDYVMRDMIFSEVKIVENNKDQTLPATLEALRSLGEIRVCFWNGTAAIEDERAKPCNFDTIESVPEKKLKGRAISHQTSLGEARRSGRYTICSFNRESKEPFAKFIFRYRSRDALKSECILPRSPTPIPLEDRPVDELTAEEAREVIRRLKEREAGQATKQELKQEVKWERRPSPISVISLGSDASDLEVTDARSCKHRRTSRPIDVIDLCDD